MARCNGLSLADRCAKRVHQLGHAGLVYFAGLMAWVLAVLFVLYKKHYFCHGARARGLHLCQCQQTAASPAAMPLTKVPTPSVSTKAAEMIAICPTAPFCLLPSFEMKNSAAHTLCTLICPTWEGRLRGSFQWCHLSDQDKGHHIIQFTKG